MSNESRPSALIPQPWFDGKVAIVTGGSGALGGAVIAELLGAGATVIAPFRKDGELERLREQFAIAAGAKLSGMALDLTDEAAITQSYAQAAQAHGGIDILVNVAGGFGGGEPVHKTPWSLWQAQLDINLKTTVLSCAAAVPHMLGRGAAIVNVGTRTATQPGANLAAYASAKRAVVQLTEALAAELRDQDITANVVMPSTIDTPANRKGDPTGGGGRWVKPAAIARVIVFLAGPDARIISGATIPVYGRA